MERKVLSVFSFEGIDKWFYNKYNSQVSISYLALWYSWLARRPVTAEVVGSSPIWVVVLQASLAIFDEVKYQRPLLAHVRD